MRGKVHQSHSTRIVFCPQDFQVPNSKKKPHRSSPAKKKSARAAGSRKGRQPAQRKSASSHGGKKWFFLLLTVLTLAATAYYFGDYLIPKREEPGRFVDNSAELQIALSRRGFSPGSIDGQNGLQTQQALKAFQNAVGLEPTGEYDEATAEQLKIKDPVFADLLLSAKDFNNIEPKPNSWRERGERAQMAFHSLVEKVGEFSQSDPDFLCELNPEVNWNMLRPGDAVLVPHITPFRSSTPAASIRISLSERSLQLIDAEGRLLFHCPVSIARHVDKRPSGELEVTVRVEDPNYTFNPSILTNAASREGITQKFIIQPGPNNPVGSVWIGLSLPSYGIHGTPEPELVGRTESSGCFRLANWNAETVLDAVAIGTPVEVSP